MYLTMILMIVIFVPFVVMPSAITAGKMSPYGVVLKGILSTGAAVALIFMVAAMTGEGVYTQLYEAAKELAAYAANDSTMIDMLNWEDADEDARKKAFMLLYDNALKQFPAFILMLGTFVSYIEYIILSRALNKRSPVRLMTPFREFTLPSNAVMALVAMYLIVWLMSSTGVFAEEAYFANVNMVFDLAFCLQGISVVFMLFYIKRIPKGFAAVLSLVLWGIPFGETSLVLLGMFDLIFGLKQKMISRNQNR